MLVAGIAVLLLSGTIGGCATMEEQDQEFLTELGGDVTSPSISYVTVDDWTIRYYESGADSSSQVVFIHGAPGSLESYRPFLTHPALQTRARLLSVDRPGYGGSGSGRVETSVQRHAELIRPLLQPGAIVVGHSFGATIAARLAMDYPGLIGGVVLVAGSLSPDHERPFFFTRAMERRVFNWLLSDAMRMANAEKYTRIPELSLMAPLWENITAPVVLFHGTRDSIVPFTHSEYAASMIPDGLADLRILPDEQHFILWTEVELIVEAILGLVDAVDVAKLSS